MHRSYEATARIGIVEYDTDSAALDPSYADNFKTSLDEILAVLFPSSGFTTSVSLIDELDPAQGYSVEVDSSTVTVDGSSPVLVIGVDSSITTAMDVKSVVSWRSLTEFIDSHR